MRLLQLKLTNFMGIRDFTLNTEGGCNVTIFGDNATGKTSQADAFNWLLFDKDSQGKKDFAIKTLDENNQPIPGLNHEVEGAFEVDGKQVTLRKVYAEKWTKKRGSAKPTFTGHTIDHYVNGVPVKKGEFDATVASIAREDIFKLLTSPTYFNEQMHWQERRKTLLDVCGDISDEDVIASDKALYRLPEILQGRKIDDHRKILAARRVEINKELEKIPVRIDEANRSLPDVSDINAEAITPQLAELKTRRQEKQQELARVKGGGEIAEKRRQLAEIEADILRLKNEHRSETDKITDAKRVQLNKLKDTSFNLQREISGYKKDVERNSAEIDDLEKVIVNLRKSWHDLNEQAFEFSQDTVCPTCGQYLPKEQLTAAREEARSEFNRDKAQSLEKISRDGKTTAAKVKEIKEANLSLTGKIADAEANLKKAESEIIAIMDEIQSLQDQTQPISNNPAYLQKLKEKEQLEKAVAELQAGNQEAIQDVNNQIADLDIIISDMEADLLKVKLREQGLERIEELKAQEKDLAAEFEKLEGELFLIAQFDKIKVRLLDEKINRKFKYARFKLNKENINGGIEPCCETLYKGVPYSSGLNSGHRNIVGLDIIATLSDHYGFYPPIIIDNAESISNLPKMKAQVIKLVKPPMFEELSKADQEELINGGNAEMVAEKWNTRNKKLRVEVEAASENKKLREVV